MSWAALAVWEKGNPPLLQETFRKAGGKPMNLNAEQARALVRRDVERWSKLVRDVGIKAE